MPTVTGCFRNYYFNFEQSPLAILTKSLILQRSIFYLISHELTSFFLYPADVYG